MKLKKTLSFDDVLLVPRRSTIKSRSEVKLDCPLANVGWTPSLPIVSSPMDTVTETNMALRMIRSGGVGVVHRYNSVREQATIVSDICDSLQEQNSKAASAVAAAVGVSSDFLERSVALYDAGARIICVDVAHGHHVLVERALKKLRDTFDNKVHLMAGNVATLDAFNDLADWGADSIRVGIGGGSICSTRIQTGHGMPTFQSILDCAQTDRDAVLIADGGIKTSGDIVKALAAGADMVMLGSMLAGTEESPGQVFSRSDGKKYKVYRGMASVEAQVEWRGEARSLEGVSTTIPFKGPVSGILSSITQNVRSGLSYSGCRTISEFQSSAQFIQQTGAGQIESNTHILAR